MTTDPLTSLRKVSLSLVLLVLVVSTTARIHGAALTTHFTKVLGQESGDCLGNDPNITDRSVGSGITYWPAQGTYLLLDNTVVNGPPVGPARILEVERGSLPFAVRRIITLTGFQDPEDIHWIPGGDGNIFVISQEYNTDPNPDSIDEIVVLRIPFGEDDISLNIADLEDTNPETPETIIRRLQFTNLGTPEKNKGIEAVALIGNFFYFATEWRPSPSSWDVFMTENTGSGIIVNPARPTAFSILGLYTADQATDISGMATDGTYLWLLSDQGPVSTSIEGRLIKMTTTGAVIADYTLPTFSGGGSWEQAEGVELFVDSDGLTKILLTGEKDTGAGVDFMTLTSTPSTVNISAFDGTAAEHTSPAPANPGQFRVTRTDNHHLVPLAVNFSTAASTATDILDYGSIGGSVTIPAGALFASINVTPVNDAALECTETVVAALAPAALPAPQYTVHSTLHTATVNILDNDNLAPQLTFVGTLGPAAKNTRYTITYEALAAAADESDPNGGVIYFRVKAAPSGDLTKNGYPGETVSPGTTYIGPGENLVWNPPNNTIGSALTAFQIVAFDGCLESATIRPVQINVLNIVVTVIADDPVVVEIPGIAGSSDQGSFTIYRAGDTSGQISIPFQLSGTVTIGGDYYPNIGSPAMMGPGVTSVRLPIDAFFGGFYEPNEYLDLQLVSNPDCYIGTPSLARVWFDSAATLPGLSSAPSIATAANLSGKVVGASGSAAASQAATWTLPTNARWENLPASSTTVPSTVTSEVQVNDLGAAKYVGNGKNAGNTAVAFVSNGTGPGTELPPLITGSDCWAYAIRADDTVAVGAARIDASTINACGWDLSGLYPVELDLGAYPDYPTTVAYDVNELETYVYVGEASGPSLPSKPLVWDWGWMDELPLPSGHDNGSARGINNNATIVGYTWSSVNGIRHAARWEGLSAPTLLALPASVAPEIAANVHTYALRVSNGGWPAYIEVIVGYAEHASFGTKAVVWYTYGVPNCYFLDEVAPVAGSQYLKALGVNDYGDISGQISTPSGNKGFVVRP